MTIYRSDLPAIRGLIARSIRILTTLSKTFEKPVEGDDPPEDQQDIDIVTGNAQVDALLICVEADIKTLLSFDRTTAANRSRYVELGELLDELADQPLSEDLPSLTTERPKREPS